MRVDVSWFPLSLSFYVFSMWCVSVLDTPRLAQRPSSHCTESARLAGLECDRRQKEALDCTILPPRAVANAVVSAVAKLLRKIFNYFCKQP